MKQAQHPPSPTTGIDRRRLVLALLLTPLLAPFYSAILFERPWDIPFGLIATYAGSLLAGLPGAPWLVRHHRRDPWSFAALGAVGSLPGMLIYAWLPGPTHLGVFGLDDAVAILGWGTASGISFWLLGIVGDAPLTLRALFDVGPPDRLD
ncbi:MAG: hypothetical protein JWQ90_1235 [Hydrocarboniphaga sp.]|uniref:hypothetical protein n=1 Tax=Hydrocarboniphaga sp. TaxID=2033016 RepID=UPI0026366493|nr:hypothetical protein [Hydrocarboniphaga sp.]MDB5968785.1 hypothetical protein [Hydrocarboniphaga sp.]